jgi:argininosuccinate lyase
MMWSGRFERAPEKEFYDFQRSFPFDRRLLPYELAVDRAWARALHGARLLTAEELERLMGALEGIAQRAKAEPAWLEASDAEDVHHFVEMQLIEQLGSLGAKLHTGRSRNELIATDFRLFVRDAAREIRRALAALITALIEQAARYPDLPMAGATHLQRAQPILYSFFLLAHADLFLGDAERVAAAARSADACPMGAGALAGCAFPVDRAAIARELGFSGVTPNSLSATSSRDFALDFLYALAVIASHLSRLAADFSLFATQEYGYVLLPDEFSTGSSLMPQKKNPDAWELIRGKAGRVVAPLFALLAALKGLPSGYQRDLQEDKEGLFDAHDQTLAMLRVAAGAVAATRPNEARMREAASDPVLLATEAAEYLVTKGIPFRQAHEIVGTIVREAEKRGQSWAAFSLAQLQKFSPAFDADVHAWLTVQSALARRKLVGGTAPDAVARSHADFRARLKALENEL